MSGCTAQAARFTCQMPPSAEAISLCVLVERALAEALGAPLERVETGADYVLVVEQPKPWMLEAHLDAFGIAGPSLGLTISDVAKVPASAMAALAGSLVASHKPAR